MCILLKNVGKYIHISLFAHLHRGETNLGLLEGFNNFYDLKTNFMF